MEQQRVLLTPNPPTGPSRTCPTYRPDTSPGRAFRSNAYILANVALYVRHLNNKVKADRNICKKFVFKSNKFIKENLQILTCSLNDMFDHNSCL